MKTIIFQYESDIQHTIGQWDREKVMEAVNMHLVGTNKVNKVASNGQVVENPEIVKHPNYEKLKEAHYKVFATQCTKILVRVYDDGSHDIVPIAKETK